MTKKKRYVKKKCSLDRLSELPNSLIFNIFELLPMVDIVRTTILSKRWQNLWTTIPWLDFNYGNKIDTDRFRNLVDGAVNSWRGIKLSRFSLRFESKPASSLTSHHIDSWMRFAVEKKVEDLKLVFPFIYNNRESYLVPQNLYSCSWLKSLWLRSCELQIHGNGNVQWDQLKSLTLNGETPSQDAINRVLGGSPRLEYFSLTLYETNQNLSIQSNSLRTLRVVKDLIYKNDAPSMETELRICTPALFKLEFLGVPYSKCLLINVSSLTTTILDFDAPNFYNHHVFSETDFVGKTLCQILPMIKHVRSVVLSNWCIKALGAMKEKHMLSALPTATYLRLKVCSEEYEQVAAVVEMFPKLRILVLQTTYKSSLPKHAESGLKLDRYYPYSFLQYLTKVDVTWTNGDDSIFPLVQILLKYAISLEKMVFSRDKGKEPRTSWKSLFTASQKLLKMKRSSRNAEFIFH